MANTKTPARPSLARKPPTKKAEAARKKMLDDARKVIRIDGVEYIIDPAGLTGLHEAVILDVIGMTVPEFVESLDSKPGIYTLGVFIWIANLAKIPAREVRENTPSLDETLADIGYGSEIEIVTAEEAAKPPEA